MGVFAVLFALALSAVPGAQLGTPWGTLALDGRLFLEARAESPPGGPVRVEPSIDRARAKLGFQSGWLKALVELELTAPAIKDAYLRAKAGPIRVRLGRMKPPVSAIELESIWDLPIATRGLVHEVLADRLRIAEHATGAQIEWRGRGRLDPAARLGAFTGKSAAFVEAADGGGRQHVAPRTSGAVRFSLSTDAVAIGAFIAGSSEHHPASDARAQHYAVGADFIHALALGALSLRVWADAVFGTTFIDHNPFDEREATFAAGRAIASIGRTRLEPLAFETFVMAEILDPALAIREDLGAELRGGVQLRPGERLRITLEASRSWLSRNTPPLFNLTERVTLLAQIGGAI